MLSLKELTEKNEISGVDIGRLIIENDILLYKQQLGIAAPETAPVTQDVIDKMTDRIETIEEAELLECYVQLQNFIKYAQAMSFAYNQQAQNGLARLIMYLTQAQQVEHARRTRCRRRASWRAAAVWRSWPIISRAVRSVWMPTTISSSLRSTASRR